MSAPVLLRSSAATRDARVLGALTTAWQTEDAIAEATDIKVATLRGSLGRLFKARQAMRRLGEYGREWKRVG